MTVSESFPRRQTLNLKVESYKCVWGKKAIREPAEAAGRYCRQEGREVKKC